MAQKNMLRTVCNPKHKPFLKDRETVFVCKGCKEKGIGPRCSCTACGIDLHMFCAVPLPTFHHPFHKHGLQFLEKNYSCKPWICDACRKDTRGFVYHCESCGFDLHPTCAYLPGALSKKDGDTTHKLRLCRKLPSSCDTCDKKGQDAGWGYTCGCRKHNLHVSCAKQILSSDASDKHGLVTGASSAITRMYSNRPLGDPDRVKKMCRIALLACRVILAALLGGPTALLPMSTWWVEI